jgi:Contact-dependent growth inhibition CdiA C-terminal domain
MDKAMDAVAAGLNGYGQMIDQFEGELRDAIIKAALEAGFETLLAGIADLLTDGVASILSGPEGAVIAARAASHLAPVVEHIIDGLRVANTVHNVDIDGHTALAAAISAMPQPDLATHEAWQAGDDVHPANNPTPRGGFDSDETAIASYVQSNGHVVMPIYADHSTSTRTPDALVDGQPVEFKTLQPTSSASAIKNTLNDTERRGGQAPEVIFDSRTTNPPITAATAAATLQKYFAGPQPHAKGVVQRVTIMLADGTKVTWPPDYAGL